MESEKRLVFTSAQRHAVTKVDGARPAKDTRKEPLRRATKKKNKRMMESRLGSQALQEKLPGL